MSVHETGDHDPHSEHTCPRYWCVVASRNTLRAEVEKQKKSNDHHLDTVTAMCAEVEKQKDEVSRLNDELAKANEAGKRLAQASARVENRIRSDVQGVRDRASMIVAANANLRDALSAIPKGWREP